MAARVYADRDDLVAAAPAGTVVPAEPEATRVLTRASERVDDLLLCAVYDVDTSGMPTNTDVVAALLAATVAQVLYWWETGDETGAGAGYSSVGIGRLNLTKAATGASGGRFAPDAVAALRRCPEPLNLGPYA